MLLSRTGMKLRLASSGRLADASSSTKLEGGCMSIQWGRILLAAFLMELVLVVIAAPLALSGAAGALNYVIPPASFIVTFAVTVWLGRKFSSRPVLQGVLIGVAGTLMYVAL